MIYLETEKNNNIMKIIDIQNIQYYFNVDRYAKHYIIFFNIMIPLKAQGAYILC